MCGVLSVNDIPICSPGRDSVSCPGPGSEGSLLPAAANLIWMDRIKLFRKVGSEFGVLSPRLEFSEQDSQIHVWSRGNKKRLGAWETCILPWLLKKSALGSWAKSSGQMPFSRTGPGRH